MDTHLLKRNKICILADAPSRIVLIGLFLAVNCGCTHLTKTIRDGLQPKPLTSSAIADKAETYNEISSAQKQLEKSFVHIEGMDVELPPNGGSGSPTEVRKYHFDVWFDDSLAAESGDAWEALRSGELVVEVLNAPARLSQPKYTPEAKSPTDTALMSRNIVRIEVD